MYASVVLALLLVNAASFWRETLQAATAPYQLDYGEGIVLYQASILDNFAWAFKSIDEYPYVVFHYPPLYHLAVRSAAHFTGDMLIAGRAVSIMSGMLIQLVITLLVFSAFPKRLPLWPRVIAALYAGLLINVLDVMRWTKLARVDMLAVLLSFLGFAIFVAGRRKHVWQYAAFVCFVAAVFCKQTMVAAPLACLTVSLFVNRRQATRLALFAVGLGVGVLSTLNWLSGGGFVRHIVLYNQNTFSLVRMLYEPAANLTTFVPIAAMGLGYAAWIARQAFEVVQAKRWSRVRAWLVRNSYRRLALTSVLLLVYSFIVSLTSGKNGSGYNYFIEWNIVCCCLCGLFLYRMLISRAWSGAVMVAYVLPLLILVGGIPERMLRLYPVARDAAQREEAFRVAAYARIVALIRDAKGPVFSEDMVLLIKAGKEVPAEPAILRELAANGTWDETPFLRMITERRFPLMVVEDLSNRRRYTATVAAAIDKAYSETMALGTYHILEPRSAVPLVSSTR